ncbi:hypothetical protein EVAR_17049_1 [Eumeta japonica]|uniref:Uncharacterized protein n=1 Tax=Eumeta variegata TaxID=151549 RepID=A0A4C1V628_EUMVA|nr:hypothetical protein EVAR_17049_1 [Eumeta japonica]
MEHGNSIAEALYFGRIYVFLDRVDECRNQLVSESETASKQILETLECGKLNLVKTNLQKTTARLALKKIAFFPYPFKALSFSVRKFRWLTLPPSSRSFLHQLSPAFIILPFYVRYTILSEDADNALVIPQRLRESMDVTGRTAVVHGQTWTTTDRYQDKIITIDHGVTDLKRNGTASIIRTPLNRTTAYPNSSSGGLTPPVPRVPRLRHPRCSFRALVATRSLVLVLDAKTIIDGGEGRPAMDRENVGIYYPAAGGKDISCG